MTVRGSSVAGLSICRSVDRVLGGVSDAERGPSVLGQDLAVKVDERDAGLFDEDVHFLLGMKIQETWNATPWRMIVPLLFTTRVRSRSG